MNLTLFHPKTRGIVENKNNSPVNIKFVAKTSDIRNVSGSGYSTAHCKYWLWAVTWPNLLVTKRLTDHYPITVLRPANKQEPSVEA